MQLLPPSWCKKRKEQKAEFAVYKAGLSWANHDADQLNEVGAGRSYQALLTLKRGRLR